MGVATGILALFCVIPGLIFAFFAEWFGWFLLDKKLSPIDSIKASFTFVSQNLGVLILFFLASLVVTFIGELLVLRRSAGRRAGRSSSPRATCTGSSTANPSSSA